MFSKKFKVLTQIVGTMTLVLLALYGLLAFVNNSAAIWAAQQMVNVAGGAQNASLLQWGESTVPLIINYQGHVEDDEGKPLTGYYTITIRIYDDVIGTTSLWEEEHVNVTTREGYFNVLLGNNESLTNTLFTNPDRFIGVTVDPYDELVPRQRFASVPYAMHSYHATKADHALEADHATQADRAYGLNAPDGDPQDAVIVDDDGKVGIGTTPSEKLDVNGNIKATGNVTVTGHISATGNIYASSLRDALFVDDDGNIGLGVEDAEAKLDVAGNIKFTGQKICTVGISSDWRDTFIVPSSWTIATCKAFRDSVSADFYALGCIFEDSFSWDTSTCE